MWGLGTTERSMRILADHLERAFEMESGVRDGQEERIDV